MRQERILELLQEAADPACTGEEAVRIKTALGCNAQDDLTPSEITRREICEELFSDTALHARHLLPKLFPVFAKLCGTRQEGRTTARINWAILEQPMET